MATKKEVNAAIARALKAIAAHDAKVVQSGNKLKIKQGSSDIEIPINQSSITNTDRILR